MGELVRLEISDGIGTIRLDRPPMNAINRQLQQELIEAAVQADADEAVRAVIVYGGEKVFAAGADIKEMLNLTYSDMASRFGAISVAVTSVARIGKPVVAAINGYALGGGFELALACDWRVAAADAKVGQPEIALGVIPGAGGTQRLSRLVGPARAKELVMSGRTLDGTQAHAMGLVDQVVPAGESVYDAALAMVSRFAEGPALALRAAKAAIDGGLDLDLPRALEWESALFTGLFATADRAEGMAAFVEKRKPRFSGR